MTAGGNQLRLSLRFLSGKHLGSEYVLADPTEVVVGRSSDVDLILIEGMVSRRHARFQLDGGVLDVEDLGSTNGTFVNGEKIRRRRLREGDRVLIGTTILKVVFSQSPVGTKPPPPPTRDFDESQTSERTRMSGDLSEVSVPELIEMFGSARQRLVLELTAPEGTTIVTIAEGKVLDCQAEHLPDAPGEKCILRALGISKGSFAVRSFQEPAERRLAIPIPELLVDGLFKLDEVTVLRQRLPAKGEKVVLARPLLAPLSSLEERDLDLLQLAYNTGDVDTTLNQSAENDLEAAKRLLGLLDGGYLRKS